MKVGLDDYLAAGHTVDDLMKLVSPVLLKPVADTDSTGEDASDAASVAERLVALVEDVEFFHSDRGEAFARFDVSGHSETWPVGSRTFRNWLSLSYHRKFGKPAASHGFEDAIRVLEGTALFDGPEKPLGVRCAWEGTRSLWIDLADKEWRAARLSGGRWEIVAEPPAIFQRFATMRQMPEPDPAARISDIELLRRFVNVRSDAGWRQVVAWLVAAWIPEIAHPVLVIHGEHGTAKSTLLRMLGRLIDASKTELRSQPKDIEQWVQAADHTWLVPLDNISGIPVWLSDAICRAVTGESYTKRKLFTDADDVIFEFRRVVVMTGIEVPAKLPDLLDRAILLGLEVIPKNMRRSEKRVLDEFEHVRPKLIGALMSVLARVLAILPEVTEETEQRAVLPRMADFANVGIAVERVLGWPEGSFLDAYLGGIEEHNAEALSSLLIFEPLDTFLDKEWMGTAQELLSALSDKVEEKITRLPDWPKNGRSLSGQLRRVAPNLRAVGIDLSFKTTTRRRELRLVRQGSELMMPMPTDALDEPPVVESDTNDANDANIRSLDTTPDETYLAAIRH